MKARRHFADVHTTDDVIVLARALRHIAAHGSATPWGLGVKTKAAYRAVDQLSATLIQEAEREPSCTSCSLVGPSRRLTS